jgi:2-amino-4-hydroxy-6-hydroxymethyldihydropteridine diphosphokinase
VALGGNLGDVRGVLADAVRELNTGATRVTGVSRLYSTAAVGSDGPAFVNAVAMAETTLSPLALLERLHQIEAAHGRVRDAHWGARTLDLDLLTYGEAVVSSLQLMLPHPHCWYRRFVLDPWCDVAADAVHPVLMDSVRAMRDRLLERPMAVAVRGWGFRTRLDDVLTSLDGIMLSEIELASIVFAESAEVHEPRVVVVPSDGDPVEFVRQALKAAMDEPRAITTMGERW